ncbi:hypothetical protein NDI44_28315 [Trichocoleus sp. DQ-A3]|uniref:virulence-associated E family protein n=1 Tax=Cyanophyceae TaxID=3028117 RepID=UPI001687370E|nr:virulence-associated E family protein [Coleofasciculus sp. FACHB-125]MBD1903684.1 hypothetical protein [Coleofasciculus sp. FACHB-125]
MPDTTQSASVFEQNDDSNSSFPNPHAFTVDSEKFDIRNFIDRLTPRKSKDEYDCPLCQGKLTINPTSGAYKCWTGNCQSKDIREAIAPWNEKKRVRFPRTIHTPKRKMPAPAMLEGGINLVWLPEPATDSPQPSTRFDDKHGEVSETIYKYSESQWVVRKQWRDASKPKGYDKTFRQWHCDSAGQAIYKKGDRPWQPYRMDEALDAAQNIDTPLLLMVEGEACVENLRRTGLAAITLQGSAWNDSELSRLATTLQESGIALAFIKDNDDAGSTKAQKCLAACAKVGTPCLIIDPVSLYADLPQKGDVVEILGAMEPAEFIRRLEEQIHKAVEEQRDWVDDDTDSSEEDDIPQTRSKTKHRYFAIARHWGNRLKLNELKNIIELDGKPLELDTISIRLAIELDEDIRKEEAIAICTIIAKRNAYNPVKVYLENCSEKHQHVPIDIDNLATRWFGTSDRLPNIYLKRYLIACVARIYQSGCQVDTSLILQGSQGFKKSTFFRVLHQGSQARESHETWFDQTMSDFTNKDERDKLHRFWCLEWGELERVLRKGDDVVKAFLSTREDTYRPPYGREPITKPRQSVIVGTTNRDEFLSDDSGDRRFWTVKIERPIDTAQIEVERDLVWASAVAAYKRGEQWHLTDEEQAQSSQANSQFHTSDSWESYVFDYIRGLQQVTTAEILQSALSFEKSRQDRASQMRVASIMKRLGWKKKKITCQGMRVNGWVPPNVPVQPVQPAQPRPTSASEVGHPSNQAAPMVSSIGVQPVQPFFPNFSEKEAIREKTSDEQSTNQKSFSTDRVSQVGQVGQDNPEALQSNNCEGVQPSLQPQFQMQQVGHEEDAITPSPASLEELAKSLLDCETWAEVEATTYPTLTLEDQTVVVSLLGQAEWERIRGSKDAAPGTSPTQPEEVTEVGGFKLYDDVRIADPNHTCSKWHGCIEKFRGNSEALVRWEEREGRPGKETDQWYPLSELSIRVD